MDFEALRRDFQRRIFMIFNNIINHLKLWCRGKAGQYQKTLGRCGGLTYVGYQVAYELEFKLSALMDKPFERTEAFQKEVVDLLAVHYEPSVIRPQNNTAMHIIDKINREFCTALDEFLSMKDSLPDADIPYNRVIVGPEAASLQDRFRSAWGYVNTFCWYPLMGDEPREITEKFYVMFDCFEPFMKQLESLIGLPETHIYRYGESIFRPQHCVETGELQEYGGNETIYTDKEFTWAIYFSHENTVSFAGSIVPRVRELLLNEKEAWNRLEMN